MTLNLFAYMPEHFRVVCIPYKALYKCSDFFYDNLTIFYEQIMITSRTGNKHDVTFDIIIPLCSVLFLFSVTRYLVVIIKIN